MNNAFEDFISSLSDDDYQGVTRSDGRRTKHGDRDDLEFSEEKSKAKLRAKLGTLQSGHIKAVIDSGYGQVQEGKQIDYRGEQRKRDHDAMQAAIAEANRPQVKVDPLGGTPIVYIAPHERGQSGNGLAQLALMLVLFLAAMSALFNG